MKYSKQRQAILDAVVGNPNHPSADEVYRQLHPVYPGLSLATVYRNLRCLAEQNILRRIPVANGPDRYDFRLQPHEHAICLQCGRIFDLKLDMMNEIIKHLPVHPDFEMTGYQLTIQCLCENCKHKTPSAM